MQESKSISSYKLEELIYNFRKSHSHLETLKGAFDEAVAEHKVLENQEKALLATLEMMKNNNTNNVLHDDIKKLLEELSEIREKKGLCIAQKDMATSCIEEQTPWYRTVVALLDKPDYAQRAKKEGIILNEYDTLDVVKYDPKMAALDALCQNESETPPANSIKPTIPRRLMGIVPPSDQPNTSNTKNDSTFKPALS